MLDQINKRTHADRFIDTTQIITKEKKIQKKILLQLIKMRSFIVDAALIKSTASIMATAGTVFEMYVVAKNARSSIKFNAQPTSMYRMQKSFRVPYFHAIFLMDTVCTVYT